MKFHNLIRSTMKELEELGFEPLFPNLNDNMGDKRVVMSAEKKKRLALDHYKAIEQADAIYFILPDGYMGTSCKLELGYALALKKPIYFSELTNDIGLDCYVEKFIPLESLNLIKI